jgi:peptide/nickel transport system permease protein
VRLDYVVRRVFLFLVITWLAATLNFFLPRISGQDPVREKLLQQAMSGGYVHTGMEEMVAQYEQKFGLDRPLWEQYVTYLGQMARLDFGYSIANYPRTVWSILGESVPWTVGLLLVTTIMAFVVGTVLGALLAWPRANKIIHVLFPPLLTLSAIPYFLLGLVLIYIFAFQLSWLPLFGGYTAGSFPAFTWSHAMDILRHSILPGLSILLSSLGFWALGMRGMMVTVQGEDYMTYAEAMGIKNRTLFFHYAIRNALLPQTTQLGLALSTILSGAILVEVIFSYPGIGTVLYQAIRQFDYFLLQGIIFTIVVGVTLATLILDLIYPFLDPRISYGRQ